MRESRERIKWAMLNSGFGYPNKAVTINLAPANVRKEGVGFDLPMAIGTLGAMGLAKAADQHLLVGELSLDGTLRPVRGVLSIAARTRRRGIPNLVVPPEQFTPLAAGLGAGTACARSPILATSAGRRRRNARWRWPRRGITTC